MNLAELHVIICWTPTRKGRTVGGELITACNGFSPETEVDSEKKSGRELRWRRGEQKVYGQGSSRLAPRRTSSPFFSTQWRSERRPAAQRGSVRLLSWGRRSSGYRRGFTRLHTGWRICGGRGFLHGTAEWLSGSCSLRGSASLVRLLLLPFLEP